MRLTLRTLLAYLDDTLEPAQTKLIGQKIAESPAAQELIARINEVVRRRRLTTPPATGPDAKVDANSIADYIDNVLPSENLAEIEETFLKSDVHLAEIAACHQILSVILSEPAHVPPTAARRMYKLIRGREAVLSRRSVKVQRDIEADNLPVDDDADETLLLGLPFFFLKGSFFRRVVPVVGVLLLFAGLGFAIWKALPSGRPIAPDLVKVAQGQNAAVGDESEATAPQPTNVPAKKNTVVAPAGSGQSENPQKKIQEGEKPQASPAEKGIGSGSVVNPIAVKPTEPKMTVAPVPVPVEEEKVNTSAPKVEKQPLGRYVSAASSPPTVLLHHENEKEPWQRLVPGKPVSSAEHLLSLPGYRSEISLESGVHLSLWGNVPEFSTLPVLESGVVLHVPSPNTDLDLTLKEGRIAIDNQKPQGEARVKLRFNNQVWELNLLDGNSEVAVELWGLPGVGFTKETKNQEVPVARIFLIALRGEINLKAGSVTYLLRAPGSEGKAPAPALYLWDNIQGAASRPESMAQLPAWATKHIPPTKQAQAMVTALEELNTRLSSRTAVEVSLPEALKTTDRESRLRVLSVYCLEAVDDLPNLLDALADERDPEVRLTSIDGLRHWIGRAPENDGKLYKTLESKYKAGQAEIVMVLLHSFSPNHLNQAETYEELIAYLRHEKLAIRTLAWWWLTHLDSTRELAQTIPYNPAGDLNGQEVAYKRWVEAIPTGTLPPKARPSTGTKPN